MKTVIGKTLVNYQDEGSGPVLLLLHGWGANLESFDVLSKHLAKRYRVVRFDFPGFGRSTIPPEDWTVDDYARLTADFLKKLNVTKLHGVLAHSFGGRVTVKLIAKHGLQPDAVVLMGAAGIKPDVNLRQSATRTVAKAGKAVTSLPGLRRLQTRLRRRLYGTIGSADYFNAGPLRQVFLNVIAEDLTDEIPSITQPTLLLWGEDDQETPVTDARKMHALIKDSRLIIIPKAGHFVYLDAPGVAEAEIDKVLA